MTTTYFTTRVHKKLSSSVCLHTKMLSFFYRMTRYVIVAFMVFMCTAKKLDIFLHFKVVSCVVKCLRGGGGKVHIINMMVIIHVSIRLPVLSSLPRCKLQYIHTCRRIYQSQAPIMWRFYSEMQNNLLNNLIFLSNRNCKLCIKSTPIIKNIPGSVYINTDR